MKLLNSQNRINELMSRFVTQVKGATAMGRTDINHVAENILIPLFSEVYGLKNLKNLNQTERKNFPGIDIADEDARVAIQITSTPNSSKVKQTLQTFVKYELFKQFDRLIIYILTEKQKSYSGHGYDNLIQGTFDFNKDRDILDYRDVLSEIATFQQDSVLRIEGILESNFGRKQVLTFGQTYKQQTEVVNLNLLDTNFSDILFVADINFDRKDIIANSEDGKFKVRKRSSTRDIARAALEQLGYSFGTDWVCHENKIITFHDLNDESLSLSKIADLGTVTSLSPEEFYEIDENYERVFKSLLWRCLQQKLYHRGVRWQNEEKLFIFSPPENGADIRKELWKDKKASEREVFVRTKRNDDPEKTWYCKHLGFKTQFKKYEYSWYMLVKPEWFFSYDGYKKSFYHGEKVDWLRKQEDNSQIMYQLKFIAYFLKNEPPSDFFGESYQYRFLSFGNLISFENAPPLKDLDWKPSSKKASRKTKSAQMGLFEK